MLKFRRLSTGILALIFSAGLFCVPVGAKSLSDAPESGSQTGTLPLPMEAKSAAEWLQGQLPEPGIGDELPVFALLRSGQKTGHDAYIMQYTEAVLAHVDDGGAEAQELRVSAWQVLVLAAAGVDVPTRAQPLPAALGDGEALLEAGQDTLRMALLALGPTGAAAPDGFDTLEMAKQLANDRNIDGGFGPDGVSDAISTARALQALAFYRHDGTVENGVVDGREWLRKNLAPYGGYDVDGSPSAVATAEAVIALCCLSEEGFDDGISDPSSALAFFQNDDGSFSENPDSPPDLELTALGLLAIVSHTRLERGWAPVYRMSDVVVAEAEISQTADGPDGKLPGLENMPPLPTAVLVLILVGTIALIVLLAVLMSSGRDMYRRRKKRRRRVAKVRAARMRRMDEESASPPEAPAENTESSPPTGEFDVSAIPMDYIGSEMPEKDD